MKVLASIALVCLVPPAALAGVVQTFDARIEGDVVFADGGVTVAGKTIPWDEIIFVFPTGRPAAPPSTGVVRLANFEVWRADILSLSAGKLTVRFGRFGNREVDATRVANFELWPLPYDTGGWSAGLHREKGEPIPGPLLWIDETRLAIDSPLGVLTLPREGVIRYVFPSPKFDDKAKGFDEVGLDDGSTLHGKVKLVAGGVQLEHAMLGPGALKTAQVRFVARQPRRVMSLAACPQRGVESPGLVTPEQTDWPVDYHLADCDSPGTSACLVAMLVKPKTVVRYTLPGEFQGQSVFSARLYPMAGSRGDVHVRVAVDGKPIVEKELDHESGAVAVRAPLPQGDELTLEVDFGKCIGFPCTAIVEDPMLIGP